MSKEVELKFRIRDVEAFKKVLDEKNVRLCSPYKQHDIIFMKKGKTFSDLEMGEVILRIRRTGSKSCTTAKKYIKGIQVREEVECGIADVATFADYLKMIGFVPLVEVKKERQEGRVGDVAITYDRVEGLGVFSEFEYMAESDPYEDALKYIQNTASIFGLDKGDIISRPYDELLYEKRIGRREGAEW